MEKKNRTADGNPRTPSLGISLIPIVAIFVLLYGSLRIFNLDVQIPLIFASIIAAFIAVVILKNKWDTIEKGIIDSIQNAMQAILIACFIGMIIGSWIAGGIVPSLIYYGLKILSPKFFWSPAFWYVPSWRWQREALGPLREPWALPWWASVPEWEFRRR